MRGFKLPRTPHGNPYSHFLKMLALFTISSAVVTLLSLGVSLTGGFFQNVAVIFALSLGSLVLGIFFTMLMRTFFGLIQTGRILQYLGFTAAATTMVYLLGLIFPAVVSAGFSLLAGTAIFAIAFLPATVLGVVPYRKRTWLPVKRKKNNSNS
ncbi:MAG TPA: hypothetical protein PKD05_10100 [Candidatus Melainabacteria bacterium]|nr:hypothetical protein [Candidatus Melainabacteria bacterium]